MSKVIGRKMAGPDHAVVTISQPPDVGNETHMRSPCAECPWRRANAGSFLAKAFEISTVTATDASTHLFACHMAGKDEPKTCAGFLLSETAVDNLGVRLGRMMGRFEALSGDPDELFQTYKQMAVANGVAPNAVCLRGCVPEAKQRRPKRKKSPVSAMGDRG
jgi:hypothetical protein